VKVETAEVVCPDSKKNDLKCFSNRKIKLTKQIVKA
jgi:hypothetical protein